MATRATLTVAETLPGSFVLSCRTRGDKPAMREKLHGIWNAISWSQWLERSRAIAYALHEMGFRPGDVGSVLANTVPEWNYADFGILCAGGVSSGIYPTDSAKQVEYLLNDSRTVVLFVEDDEQLDKALEVRERCPTLRKIVIFDMEGLTNFSDPMVVSLDEFMANGRNHAQGREALFDEMVAARGPDDLAILVYTSGTTGPPKGAMHSHRNVVAQMRNCMHPGLSLSWEEGDERLAFLPLCHVAERVAGSYYSVATGVCSNFAESPETVPDNIREVQPTLFGAVPRVWEKFYSGITIALKDATPLQQWAYRKAIAAGYAIADARLERRPPTALQRLWFQLAYWLVLKNVRKMIGLDRCRWLFTGAAPIAPELIRWYLALGLDMFEVYGQTENCGLATAMPGDAIKLGTVGKAVPYGEVMISPLGEILIRGEFVFMGYLNQPEKSAETVDREGWLHTGDVGAIDNEGYVRITDRMKDIIITAGGKNITPSEIENQLKFSPYISDAVVIGDRRPYLTCLVMIERETVEKYAQDHDVPFTNYVSLCRAKEVQDLIWAEIERVNTNFARVETIKRFYLIEQQLTPEDEELTPTMKLKRSFVNRKYKDEIDAMYRAQAA
ncbi:AMP-dependent synthetase/ligase [Reyranella sp.]|uniref:AMP-dependent synthetase/ligase n=1 Tax=Reyranella sp. TaxID=1929291 RepID=UPI003BABD524